MGNELGLSCCWLAWESLCNFLFIFSWSFFLRFRFVGVYFFGSLLSTTCGRGNTAMGLVCIGVPGDLHTLHQQVLWGQEGGGALSSHLLSLSLFHFDVSHYKVIFVKAFCLFFLDIKYCMDFRNVQLLHCFSIYYFLFSKSICKWYIQSSCIEILPADLIVLICPARYKGSSSLNLTLPELDYKNLFLLLLMAGTQLPLIF